MVLILAAIPFFILSLAHLTLCATNKIKAADVTKIMLMPSLIVVLFVLKGNDLLSEISQGQLQGTELSKTFWYIILALTAGTVGDFFMLHPGKKRHFVLGTVFFAIGHIFYLFIMIPRSMATSLPGSIFPWFLVIYIAIIILQYLSFDGQRSAKTIIALFYCALLLVVNFYCFVPIIVELRHFHSWTLVPKTYLITAGGNSLLF